MALLAISLPADQSPREMLALVEVIQRELLPSPEDACLVTRDPHGDVRLRQSVHVTPRGAAGTFWITLVQRMLELREGRVGTARGARLASVLRPGRSTLFVITRSQPAFDGVLALARAVGGRVLHLRLSRQSEFALTVLGLMPSATHDAA
jgi:uncharacterized membrane protein